MEILKKWKDKRVNRKREREHKAYREYPWKRDIAETLMRYRKGAAVCRKLNRAGLRASQSFYLNFTINVRPKAGMITSMERLRETRGMLKSAFGKWEDRLARVYAEGNTVYFRYTGKYKAAEIVYILFLEREEGEAMIERVSPGCYLEKVVTEDVSERLVCAKEEG